MRETRVGRGNDMRYSPARGTSMPGPEALWLEDEERVPPPAHTPDQAEGEDEDAERERDRRNRGSDPLRRRRPGQAEGEDSEDEADRVPPED